MKDSNTYNINAKVLLNHVVAAEPISIIIFSTP